MQSFSNNFKITCVLGVCPQGVDLNQTGSVFVDLVIVRRRKVVHENPIC